jgi:hypothetical protein
MNKIVCPHGISPKNKCKQCANEFHKRYAKTQKYKDMKKLYYQKNRKHLLALQKVHRDNQKKQIVEILGIKCFFCPMTKKDCKVNYHEIHGIKHPYKGTMKNQYIINHIQNFIPVCEWCHKTLHSLARNREKQSSYLFFANKIKPKVIV